MNPIEAKWIADTILQLPLVEHLRVLNIGSSTRPFRTHCQPHIESLIFGPLRERNIKVVHQDIKEGNGVDIVGDLTNRHFLCKLKDLKCNLVLCNNLLEHLVNREPLLILQRNIGSRRSADQDDNSL